MMYTLLYLHKGQALLRVALQLDAIVYTDFPNKACAVGPRVTIIGLVHEVPSSCLRQQRIPLQEIYCRESTNNKPLLFREERVPKASQACYSTTYLVHDFGKVSPPLCFGFHSYNMRGMISICIKHFRFREASAR